MDDFREYGLEHDDEFSPRRVHGNREAVPVPFEHLPSHLLGPLRLLRASIGIRVNLSAITYLVRNKIITATYAPGS